MQALNSMRMIRIFGQEAREHARFVQDSGQVRKAQFRLEAAWRTMQPLVDLLYVPLLLGILVIAWYAEVGLAVLLPFLFLVFRLQRYARDFDLVPAPGRVLPARRARGGGSAGDARPAAAFARHPSVHRTA